MQLLANILWIAGSMPLLAMVLSAKPTRGENLTAFHLVTGPAALPPAIAAALHLWLARDTLGHAVWFGWLAIPGAWVSLLAMPAIATARRGAIVTKGIAVSSLVAIGALGNPVHGAPWFVWIGFATVVALGAAAYGVAAQLPLRRLAARFAASRRPPGHLDPWQQGQAEFQRTEWRGLPADPSVARLLDFVRAFAPEVKAASLDRLAGRPHLDEEVSALLAERGGDSNLLHYVVHHYPRSRRGLAAAMQHRLEQEHDHWTAFLATAAEPHSWTGNLLSILEAGLAVAKDGGDLRAPLERWQRSLAAVPRLRAVAKELARHLR